MPQHRQNEHSGGGFARITEMTEIPPLQPGELDQMKIVHPMMLENPVLAAFRNLDRELLGRAAGRNFIVGVATAAPGGGASFVSLNLASTIAMDHHRTALLVECGRDTARLGKLLLLQPDAGLMDFLAQPALEIESIVFSSRIPRLRVIPHGRSDGDPSLLGTVAMQQLLQAAKTRYADRVVVVDLPHSMPMESVRCIAQWCDFMILVVPYGMTSASQVRQVVEAIGRDRVTGVVFNRDPLGPGASG